MDEQAEKDKLIELGMKWDEFFKSWAGHLFIERIQLKIGETLTDQNSKKTKGGFECDTLGQFERHRGFFLALSWVKDDLIPSTVNAAKRMERERQEQEKH